MSNAGQGIPIDVALKQALAEIGALKKELAQLRSGIIQELLDKFIVSEVTEMKKKVAEYKRDHTAMERLRNNHLEVIRIDGGWRIQYPPEDCKEKFAKAAYKPEDLADAIIRMGK
jgi:hypothetical protein